MKNKKILIASILVCVLLITGIIFNSLFSNAKEKSVAPEVKSNNLVLEESEDQEDKKNQEEYEISTSKEEDIKQEDIKQEDIKQEDIKQEDIKQEVDSDISINHYTKEESSTNNSKNNTKEEESKVESNNEINNSSSSTGNNTTIESNKPSVEEEKTEPQKNTVTVAISCKTAIKNGVNKEPGFTHLPSSGTILKTTTVEIKEDETVFEVLEKVVRQNNIHMEYSGSGSSIYIEGIDNLYEFDGGQNSGWMYSVNGWYPNYGCGTYKLKANDVIKWEYTCDLGVDLGARQK